MTHKEIPPARDEWRFDELRTISLRARTGTRIVLQWCLYELQRNALLVILTALLITGWQVYRMRSYLPVYEGKASFIYKELHKKTYGEMIDKLELFAQEGAHDQIAEQLHIPAGQARQIREIKALNMYGAKLSEDITTEKAPFYIQVKLSDNSASDGLALKIADYLNSNPYNRVTISERKAALQAEVGYLEQELRLLDSFKLRLLNSGLIPVIAGAKETEIFNPVQLFDKSIEVSRALVEKNTALDHMEAVSLLNDFSLGGRPVLFSKKEALLKGLAVFAIATLIIVVLSSILRKK